MKSSSVMSFARGFLSASAFGEATSFGRIVTVRPGWLFMLAGALLALAPGVQADVATASVEIVTPHPAVDGRVGLFINGSRTTSAGGPVTIHAVRIEGEQLEIVLTSSPGQLPMFDGYSVSVMLDGLAPGDYQGRVLAREPELSDEREVGEFGLSVMELQPDNLTVSYRSWPADPTVFDRVWTLFDPIRTCSETQQIEGPGLEVDEIPADCPSDTVPRSSMFDRGTFDAGLVTGSFQYRLEGELVTQSALRLIVRDRLSSRMAGSWYNPAESGHGISLEVTGPNQLLVYWYTFDNAGDPLWLIAMGDYQGQGLAVLQADRVSGGQFPPSFDPSQIELHHWGELELEFHDCSEATLRWLPEDPSFAIGEMPLVRLTRSHDHDCVGPPPESALKPTWFRHGQWYYRVDDDTLVAPSLM